MNATPHNIKYYKKQLVAHSALRNVLLRDFQTQHQLLSAILKTTYKRDFRNYARARNKLASALTLTTVDLLDEKTTCEPDPK